MPRDTNEEPNPNQDALDSVMKALAEATSSDPAAADAPAQFSDADLSPTFSQIRREHRPNPMPVCGACPKSVWWATAKKLECYCQLMHARTWTSEDPEPIEACDGFLTQEE